MNNFQLSTETNTVTNTMNIGDVVYLNSNPEVPMTILYILGPEPKNVQNKTISYQMKMQGFQEGDICCNWFEDGKIQTNFFKAAMITKKINRRKEMFSSEYPIFGTKNILIKFHCKECNKLIEDVIDEIPTANLAGGDSHAKTLNSDVFTAICSKCGKEYTFYLGSSCCGGEIVCNELEQDDVKIEIEENN